MCPQQCFAPKKIYISGKVELLVATDISEEVEKLDQCESLLALVFFCL